MVSTGFPMVVSSGTPIWRIERVRPIGSTPGPQADSPWRYQLVSHVELRFAVFGKSSALCAKPRLTQRRVLIAPLLRTTPLWTPNGNT